MKMVCIDQDKCIRCGFCAQDCLCFTMNPGEVPSFRGELSCVRCGHCVTGCPAEAVQHQGIPSASIQPTHRERMPEYESVMELIRTRRSRRTFTDRPVERELLEKILDAAVYAPSAENNQSTELVIVQNKQVISDLVKRTIGYLTTNMKILKNPVMGRVAQLLYGEMLKGENRQRLIQDMQLLYERYMHGDDWILHYAPAVILFHGNKQMTLAAANANLAVQNASLVVETLGLSSFYAGYLVVAAESNREISRSLGIPTANKIYGALAVGYPQYEYKKWVERANPKVKWL